MATIRIYYDGRLALTLSQAAARHNLDPDAMRQALYRLKRAGEISELPETLDGRKLYLATQVDRAMKRHPRRGSNLRKAPAEAPAIPQARPPADYVPYGDRKPYTVADDLATLTGPTSGVVDLPHHLDWSGTPTFDLSDPARLVSMYEVVLNEASSQGDLTDWLNGVRLIELWPTLYLPPRVRLLWEARHPVLASLRSAPTKG